jgi:hypothetical protein
MKNFLLFMLMLCIVAALVLWWSPELRKEADNLLRDTGLKSTSVPEGIPYKKIEARSDVNVLPLPEQLKTDE